MDSKFLKYSVTALLMAHQASSGVLAASETECYERTCRPIEQYCSQFEQGCANCSSVCDPTNHKFDSDICSGKCNEFIKLQNLENEIHHIQVQQNVILILLILLLVITAAHFTWKLMKWLQEKRYLSRLLKKLKFRKQSAKTTATAMQSNGKDIGGTTIQNMCVINDDIERAPSQIYSIGAEGSVRTVTTPISTRYPAENTTPSPQPNEYSYDNQGLVVTPVSDKPSGGVTF